MSELQTTPLHALHTALGARMVPFAGYNMPVQYGTGIIKEHLHTRAHAGLFDVSHMGQVIVSGEGATQVLESLLPTDLQGLDNHRSVYSLLMNEQGGVRDDLIITRLGADTFLMVLNAGCKSSDLDYLQRAAPSLDFTLQKDRVLLALQGPQARNVLGRLLPDITDLVFMSARELTFDGHPLLVTCSGYTGEDGFEVSMDATGSEHFARVLLAQPEVQPIGLGARDSLRLEAGLCLYGHELDEDISPIEAGIRWAISKSRRPGGARSGGYPGAGVLEAQMRDGVERSLVALRVEGKRPVREGQAVINLDGQLQGFVTSAAFGATLQAPCAMALMAPDCAEVGARLAVDVRGKPQPVTVIEQPLVPHRYYRG